MTAPPSMTELHQTLLRELSSVRAMRTRAGGVLDVRDPQVVREMIGTCPVLHGRFPLWLMYTATHISSDTSIDILVESIRLGGRMEAEREKAFIRRTDAESKMEEVYEDALCIKGEDIALNTTE